MEQTTLPNIRKIFIPDNNWIIFDCDLSGADAQVVAWEADDEDLKAAFRAGVDIHEHNAEAIWGEAFTKLAGDKHGGPKKKRRQACKHAVHGTNYIGSAKAIAHHPAINWTVHEADQFQKRWFSIHPKIGPVTKPGTWHYRVQQSIDKYKMVENKFGYRRIYFDRPDAVLPEAIAWVPQSTVALVTFYGAIKLESNFCLEKPIEDLSIEENPNIQMLLQNHDSLVFQVREQNAGRTAEMKKHLSTIIPYDDPLTIPWGFAKSRLSWGEVEELKVV
jgi:DNA polymerase I-like protein with 3'-5' exonuclease and polymerase domains